MEPNAPLVVVIGSSVAEGCYAPTGYGWACLLGKYLEENGYRFLNHAISGYNSQATLDLYKRTVMKMKPAIVIIGLSIANEGLNVITFMKNMTSLVELIKKNGGACIVAGVYPNNFYSEENYQVLLNVQRQLLQWKNDNFISAYFDFMSTVDDGKGHWHKGTYADASHPNQQGHKKMFDAIDLSVFESLCLTKSTK